MTKKQEPQDENTPESHTRPTVGFFTVDIAQPWTLPQWLGAIAAARARDVNLICFNGGSLSTPERLRGLERLYESQANILYELASDQQLDGLIIYTTGVMAGLETQAEMIEFCNRYHPLPLVGIETPLPGVPSVLMDNQQPIRELVAHLVETHGYRRIAFVHWSEKVHSSHHERYLAYAETLTEHELFDPNLVCPVDGWVAGAEGIAEWLSEEGRGDIDAVVGNSDNTSLLVVEALRLLGRKIPDDVAVTGFDHNTEGQALTPPLTTARSPFFEMGYQAVETLLAILAGEAVPEQMVLPTPMVVRQSCGCSSQVVARAGVVPRLVPGGEPIGAALLSQREAIAAEMAASVSAQSHLAACGQLFDAFLSELDDDGSGVFLATLNDVVEQTAVEGSEVEVWQEAVTVLQQHSLAYLDDRELLARVGTMWQQARVLIGEVAVRDRAYQAVQAQKQAQAMQEMSQRLLITLEVQALMNVLAEGLPRLGIGSAYVSLYNDPQPYAYPQPAPEWSRLVLAYHDQVHEDLPSDGLRFPSRQLVPERLWPQDRRYVFVLEAVYFQDEQLGFVLFEFGPQQGNVYHILRGQISSVLKGALVLRAREEAEAALERAYTEVEKQVQERTAELEEEVARREEMQREVINSQRRALQELSTPIIPVMDRIIVMPLIGTIDSFRARDITRSLLSGIRQHQAKVVILDVTGVPIVDSGVANHLNKTIQAARLKGARTIVTGISDAVAETIVDLGIDWSGIATMPDLQTGLRAALAAMGMQVVRQDRNRAMARRPSPRSQTTVETQRGHKNGEVP